MKNRQILEKVAELVGFKFDTDETTEENTEVKFAMVELEGGYIVSNQKDDDFVVGDTIYLVNEDGTYSVVGAGTWKYLDGEKTLTTDEEGTLTSIEEGTDDVEDETTEETETSEEEEMTAEKVNGRVEELKQAIHDVLFAFNEQSKELNELKNDYEEFKKSATHTPLKEDKVVSKAFSTDSRYEVLKAMREAKKK